MQRSIWKRLRTVAVIAAVGIAVTGCVDVVQYISGTGSTIDVYLRFALQKSAFEMANSFSDDPQDLDEMFAEDFDLERAEVLETLPPGITADYQQLDSDFEYGFELSYSADRAVLASLGEEDSAFVPRVGTRGMTIPLAESGENAGGGGGGGGGQGDEFAGAFLGGAKYRVLISRRLVSRVSSATLVGGDEPIEVTVTELPDIWMIEFPVSLWLMGPKTTVLEIVY